MGNNGRDENPKETNQYNEKYIQHSAWYMRTRQELRDEQRNQKERQPQLFIFYTSNGQNN